MAAEPRPDIWALTDLATPWCVHVVVTLRVGDHIAAGHTHIDDLAKVAQADAESLGRVLRHLARKGVFDEPAPGVFALNDAARKLLHPGARIGFDLDGFGGRMAHVWSTLLTAVRTGAPAYHTVFGQSFWDDLRDHPRIGADFDTLMGAGHGTPDPEVLVNRDWDAVRTVVDVGGGTGSLLTEILLAHPTVKGTLVDLPSTVARSAVLFDAAGVADRVTTLGQSFFDPLPAGADVYLMKNVLADWPDREALALLTNCATAARSAGRIVILGGVSPDDVRANPELLMMVLVGGKDRSLTEFRALAKTAVLDVTAHGRQQTGKFIVECRTV